MKVPTDRTARFIFYLGSILYLCLIGILFISVFFHYIIGHALYWSEEVNSFFFIWVSYIGIVLAMEDDSHLRIDTLLIHLSPSVRRIFDLVNLAIVAFFCILLTWLGIEIVMSNMEMELYATSVPVSIAFISVIIPLSFIVMALYCTKNFIKLLKTDKIKTN